jgi:opacity protein-like surface antigen
MVSRVLFVALFIAGFVLTGFSQSSTAFGVKGGASLAIQQWDGYQRRPLFAYHGIAFIESVPEANEFAIFAQLGWHQKGSSEGGFLVTDPVTGERFRASTRKFIFNNIALTLGGKQKYDLWSNSKWYYMIGLRGEYTISTNLDQYFDEDNPNFNFFYPIPPFVEEWNYGVTVGGGIEFPFSELVSGLVEFTVNPDFSNQYIQPEIPNVRDPITGQLRSIPSSTIRNTVLELTIGIRFLRKVIYID